MTITRQWWLVLCVCAATVLSFNLHWNHGSDEPPLVVMTPVKDVEVATVSKDNFYGDTFETYNCKGLHKKPGSLPRFMVIGVHKGGSTALYGYLAQHGHIRPAVCKEINFFNRPKALSKSGLKFYKRHFPDLSGTPWVITGEGTPNYIRMPDVPGRVREHVPDVKIVLSVRDPVKRFISHYVGFVERKITTLSCDEFFQSNVQQLQECMNSQDAKLHPITETCSSELNSLAIVRSMYTKQLLRWLAEFPPEQIFIVQAEEMFKNLHTVMQRVASFLELRAFTTFELESFAQTNVGSHHSQNVLSQTCDEARIGEFLYQDVAQFKSLLVAQFPGIIESWVPWDMEKESG